MHLSFIRHLPLILLCLLSACSRDVTVSTVLAETGGIRPGDVVYLESLAVGVVDSIQVAEQTPGFTVGISLSPEHAELIRKNAVAYVPLTSPPRLKLLNPTEVAPAVLPGDRLKGLSPLEVAVWQAGDAATAAGELAESFARQIDAYFESEEWERARAQFELQIEALAAESHGAAERSFEALEELMASIAGAAAESADRLNEDVSAIEESIAELEAHGQEKLAASLRRLLEQIEKVPESGTMTPEADSEGDPKSVQDAQSDREA
jgi:ABC-type transporter Mla subunit MlaD